MDRVIRRGALAKRALFGATMLGGLAVAGVAAAAPALPSGGVVVAGSASIGAPSGSALTVSQSSAKAIIDWTGFGVGQGASVRFDNGSGATLNRVTGSSVSSIEGLLSATGSVYLINPNGVIVGKTGVVDTGGSFVASTLGVGDASFLAGGPLSFSGPSSASVVNLGKVSSLGGDVAMIAATVSNAGSISAPNGTVGLIAGSTVTMDDTDNDAGGLFSVQVGSSTTSAANSGAIAAAAVELRAQQGNVYALAGNTGGVIDATGVDASGGVIKLISTGGTTTVTGTLSAQGPNGTGGQIETSGATLSIGGASVDTHGGAWLLDPTSLIVNAAAAATINTALETGSVTLATSTGGTTGPGVPGDNYGDILIEAPLTWSTGSTLTLNSYGSIAVDDPITVTGAGKVVMTYGTGDLTFDLGPSGFGGSLSFAKGTGEGVAGQALSINGTSYTLLYSMTDVAGINGSSGDYALAVPIIATITYTAAVVASFSGTLEGLGNSISDLTINGGSNNDVGLIGTLDVRAFVRDLGLVGGTVSGGDNVGELVGSNEDGTVESNYATGSISGTSEIGGLVGLIQQGSVEASYATGAVSGGSYAGGLSGSSSGTVETSYATGAVSGNTGIGGLVAFNSGTIETSHATGAVSGGQDVGGLVGGQAGVAGGLVVTSYATGAVSGSSFVGGLVGDNARGAVATSYSTGRVSGTGDDVGGLVGYSYGTIETSYATGAVSGSQYVGGVVGQNFIGTVETSYATGAVTGIGAGYAVGGLVGYNYGGTDNATIESSHATGKVSGGSNVGGLVGYNYGGTVETSYATGGASATGDGVGGLAGSNLGSIETSYATGAVSGASSVGGLVGNNVGLPPRDSSIVASYATGAVSGSSYVGGLAGFNNGAEVEQSYATGAVSGSSHVGGLVGKSGTSGTVSGSYWDTGTTGQSATETGATGLTTAQLQSDSGGYMTNLGSAFAGGTGGLYPYLVNFFPSGVQAIVGTATSGGSSAAAAAAQVGIYYGGALLGAGTVSTGHNGYIYLAVAAGTLGASGDKIGANITLSGGSAPTGLVYTDAGSVTSAILTLPALASGLKAETTSELTLSALDADLGATFGSATYAGLQTALASTPLTIDADGASFTVNQALTLTGTGALSLDAGGALAVDAPITVTGGGQVALTYGAGGLSFDLGPSGFGGSLSYAVGSGEGIAGQALSINGTSYKLLYSMADVTGIDGTTGHDALAAPIAATASYTSAPVGNFDGTLEGLGNSIGGLSIDSAGDRVGLIGTLYAGGAVHDVELTGGSVSGVSDVGGLVGYNAGTITDASASATVAGSVEYIGGLVGYNAGAISTARARGNVSAPGGLDVGGLVGYNAAGVTISASVASGATVSASGGEGVGGLVGINAGTVIGSSAAEEVVNGDHGYATGGLVGDNGAGATISDSTASGTVYGGDDVRYSGGLAGYNDGQISDDSSTGLVSVPTGLYVGGLVGYNYKAGTISSAYATGAVSASGGGVVGGLAGYNAGTISDTYAYAGSVSAEDDVGGLIGYNAGAVSTSWSSGAVSGTTDVGGSIGDQTAGTLGDVYWDEGTSGLTNGTGSGASTGLAGIGGTTGLSPDAQATYAGFNFTTIWTIDPGTSRAFLKTPAQTPPPN